MIEKKKRVISLLPLSVHHGHSLADELPFTWSNPTLKTTANISQRERKQRKLIFVLIYYFHFLYIIFLTQYSHLFTPFQHLFASYWSKGCLSVEFFSKCPSVTPFLVFFYQFIWFLFSSDFCFCSDNVFNQSEMFLCSHSFEERSHTIIRAAFT